MLETLEALKTCKDASSRRELVRKRILKLRWIGEDKEAEKLSEKIAELMPSLIVPNNHQTD